MLKNFEDKALKPGNNKEEKKQELEFFFPQEGVTVKAESLNEAIKEMQKITNKSK